jgi:DnaJ-class molecular chaperone
MPNAEDGDIIVEFNEHKHPLFKRRGADLAFDKEISLLEALTGVEVVIKQLDGHVIKIRNKPGEIIKPNELKTVENCGMPLYKKPLLFGNLFILFFVKFPTELDANSVNLIKAALKLNTI